MEKINSLVFSPSLVSQWLYVDTTPRWKVWGVYGFGLIAWGILLWGFSGVLVHDLIYTFFVLPLVVFMTVYHLISMGIILCYKKFKKEEHYNLLNKFWGGITTPPTVDIFLPICNEEESILENTWWHVAQLTKQYPESTVYVLDDSSSKQDVHKERAELLGFKYLERPNKGECKKAGNLKYGYQNSKSEFIIIFDADFAPKKNFIREVLPYFSDISVAIVQTPQYFEVSDSVYKNSPLEYGAAYVQEDFYRIIQVARDRLGGGLCVGSNAMYRRSALDSIGGTVQIEHSEDAHTGFALTNNGFKVKYLPIILAVGLCPNNVHNYFHQQHRWASGSMSLLLSKKFWTSSLNSVQRSCYLTGFMYYLNHPVGLLMSFQAFLALFLYNDYISITNGLPFYPYIIFSFVLLPIMRLPKIKWGVYVTTAVQVFSYTHAVFSGFLSHSVGWVPTNTKRNGVSYAFRQMMLLATWYTGIYIGLLALAVYTGIFHFMNISYYSVQFWILFHVVLSLFLLYLIWKEYFYAGRK